MNKIECIADHLVLSRGPFDGRRHSNLAELPLPAAKSRSRVLPLLEILGPGQQPESLPTESEPQQSRAGLRLVTGSDRKPRVAMLQQAHRHMVDGAYLFAAVSVAAVLWWTTF